MPFNPRVQQLIEEVLEAGSTAEEVCRAAPDLKSQVREGCRRFRVMQAQVSLLFPELGAADFDEAPPLFADDLPRVPGYDVTEELGRGGVGVVYKARHLRLNRPVALNWRGDPDLKGLRDHAELSKLSDGERREWLQLWDESGVVFGRSGRAG